MRILGPTADVNQIEGRPSNMVCVVSPHSPKLEKALRQLDSSLVAVHGRLIAEASLVAEHGLRGRRA